MISFYNRTIPFWVIADTDKREIARKVFEILFVFIKGDKNHFYTMGFPFFIHRAICESSPGQSGYVPDFVMNVIWDMGVPYCLRILLPANCRRTRHSFCKSDAL